jgi:hypothetical protein
MLLACLVVGKGKPVYEYLSDTDLLLPECDFFSFHLFF